MKNKLLILFVSILSTYCYSQISYEKGYYIDNKNKKINCLIKNLDWKNNPTEFEYKLTEQDEPKKNNIASIQEFGIENISKYIRRTVNIDKSSKDLDKLSNNRNPIFNEETLFLRVLIEGKASLYEYIQSNLRIYLYNNDNSKIEQLIFKSYKTIEDKYAENNLFRQQLSNSLKCQNLNLNRFKNINYKRNELINLFIEYYECNNQKVTTFENKQKRNLFNLNIRPRLVNSSLMINHNFSFTQTDSNGNLNFSEFNISSDFGNTTNVSFGIEAEFILPFYKNKWAIIIEPTYQNFKSETTNNTGIYYGGSLTTDINYSSIEIPIGVRHYFFLNDKSKIFINASRSVDFSFNSYGNFLREDGLEEESLKINSDGRGNWAFGLGYKYNNRYSIELRQLTRREILNDYTSKVSDYKSFSIILGYTIL
jgi:hypothetical protein